MRTKSLGLIFLLISCSMPALGQIPSKISYQGVLRVDSASANGSYEMVFALFDASSGGSAVWTEQQTVAVVAGIFNVLLGSVTPIPDTLAFDVPYWLQVTVSNSVLLPRVELTTSAYSFNTQRIQGSPVSISSPSTGQVLKWTGTEWAPNDDASGGGGTVTEVIPGNGLTTLTGTSITTSGEIKIADGGIIDAYIAPSTITLSKLNSSGAGSGDVIKWTGSTWAPGTGIGGSGTSGYVPRWTASTSLSNSPIRSDASNVSIGSTISSLFKFKVDGGTTRAINALSSGGAATALWAEHTGTGNAGAFYNNNSSPTIYVYNGTGPAGYFNGSVQITGTLSKGGGSFEIDHPVDPENMILRHSFVESPDMMNVYNGNIVTDARGFGIVELPHYFDALNRDFRYQLTAIGQFARAIISSEVQNNQFTIQTDMPNVKVSWQVTGIRKDAWAENNRIVTEEIKSARNKGFYIHPSAFGQPESALTKSSTTP